MNIDEEIIRLENINLSFGKLKIIENLLLKINKNEITVIIGPGGCGKTLLLKLMAGIINPDNGQIIFQNKNILHFSNDELFRLRKKTGFLFQNYALFDSLNIYDNIGFFLFRFSDIDKKTIINRIDELLEMINLPGIGELKPAELSGGMKKRVGIARALIHKPEVLFLDEPSAGLDPISADSISKLILNLQKEFNVTIIAVSNEMICTMKIANKIALMYKGKIHYINTLQNTMITSDPVVKQFIKGEKEGPIKY